MGVGCARLAASLLKGSEQRLLNRHANTSSRSIGFQLAPQLLAPIAGRLRSALVFKKLASLKDALFLVPSLVVVLLNRRGPSAVLRRVARIVIDAIKAMAVTRSAAHVRQEVLVQAPSFANGDAAPSVVNVVSVIPVVAAAQHRGPRSVLRTLLAVAAFAVAQVANFAFFAHHLSAEAPTGLASSRLQYTRANCVQASTFTHALPIGAGLLGDYDTAQYG